MNQRRRRSTSRPAVSLDPLFRGDQEDVVRKSKELVEPTEPLVKIQAARKTEDRASWNYPKIIGKPVWIALGITALALAWAYGPTLVSLATTWEREPDYSMVGLSYRLLVTCSGVFETRCHRLSLVCISVVC